MTIQTENSTSQCSFELGTWLQFTTKEDLSKSSLTLQTIYGENQRFFIFAKETDYLSTHYMIDIHNLQIFSYSGTLNVLETECLIENGEIKITPQEAIINNYSIDKVRFIIKRANSILKEWNDLN